MRVTVVTPVHPDSIFADVVVRYRPVIGFGPDCTICGKVTFRYGTMTSRPNAGMPQSLRDAHDECGGHAIHVDDVSPTAEPGTASIAV